MENKIRLLKVLETIHKANSKIEVKRLEELVNTSLFNIQNDTPLWGGELLDLLNELKDENKIFQDDQKKYSITPEGLKYLRQN